MILTSGCSKGETPVPDQATGDYRETALAFTKSLAARDYAAAYAHTAKEYRESTSVQAMQAAFERVVPLDWKTVGPIAVGETMESWPGKQPPDVRWVYVTIGGDMYSEAVTVVVTREGGALRIRSAEFGRP